MASMCLTVTRSIPAPSRTLCSCALQISTASMSCDIKCLVLAVANVHFFGWQRTQSNSCDAEMLTPLPPQYLLLFWLSYTNTEMSRLV